jgi:coenzyme F420-0:L-glutamate ligase / coenzyme F420-1:gamma-L-glutamate ligase
LVFRYRSLDEILGDVYSRLGATRRIIATMLAEAESQNWNVFVDERLPPPPDRSSLSFDEIIRGRRSIRQYQPRPVPPELIVQLIDAARWAPSPHGRMPWRFVVLTQPEPKERLASAMAEEWQRNLEMDQQPPEIVATRLQKSRARVEGAPVVIVPCLYLNDLDRYPDSRRQQAERTMAIQSLGAAIQNLLLTAYQLGLDTGWMCAPLFCPELVVVTLDLDPSLIPQALIMLGYAVADPQRRERLPLETIIARWE